MFASDQYELLDFGEGRKLERFGPYVLDRPSAAAERATRQRPHLWTQSSARFERNGSRMGHWSCAQPIDQPWPVNVGSLAVELKLTSSGQLGIFPEQADNWRWIDQQVRHAGHVKVLNLFAYTGVGTLAAAAAGAEVVHVDAASSAVAWARRNADASKLNRLPIRWIAEDVIKFVGRERKRGNRYDAVILDPPAYGHGPQGQTWKLDSDLDELFSTCLELCRGRTQFLLLTCHSGRLGLASELLNYIVARHPNLYTEGTLYSGDMSLVSLAGRRLHCGAVVRWSRGVA
jgi:23S rRNA (cytosine1962-C5)-methyltransferase